jgi:hypothetical protein
MEWHSSTVVLASGELHRPLFWLPTEYPRAPFLRYPGLEQEQVQTNGMCPDRSAYPAFVTKRLSPAISDPLQSCILKCHNNVLLHLRESLPVCCVACQPSVMLSGPNPGSLGRGRYAGRLAEGGKERGLAGNTASAWKARPHIPARLSHSSSGSPQSAPPWRITNLSACPMRL